MEDVPGDQQNSQPAPRPRGRWYALAMIALLAGAGIAVTAGRHSEPVSASPAATPVPAIHVVRPEVRDLVYTVGQPGFVEAYEQTSLYSKVSGFIKKFSADIGQEVKAGQVLAEIFVPELEEERQQKAAQVELDRNGVAQAQQLVKVAESRVKSAAAEANEAKANIGKYQADAVRWEAEVKRLAQVAADKVLDPQVLDEAKKELEAARSARDAAQAAAIAREADRTTAEADLAKARIDVEVARSKVKVVEAEERRAGALLSYTKITAPYDGVVTVRNANTGDFVHAVSGDGASGASAIFVVARTDLLRIFVDIPESYARYVGPGTKAAVRAQALNGLEIPATVTRTSWGLQARTRTLRAEIDLEAKQAGGLRPGMYVYGSVVVDRPKARTLPQQDLLVQGNQCYCYLLENGKVVRAPIECGMSDGTWVEVLQKKTSDAWTPVTGGEQVIQGDLTELADGQAVRISEETREKLSPTLVNHQGSTRK